MAKVIGASVDEYRGNVIIYYTHKGKKLRLSTGIKKRDENKKENQLVILSLLRRVQNIIDQHYKDFLLKPDVDYIKSRLSKKEVSNTDSLTELFEQFLTHVKDTPIRTGKNKGLPIRTSSLTDFTNLQTALKDYDTTIPKPLKPIDIDSVEFFTKFQRYLSKDRGLNTNTIRKRMIRLKMFLKWMVSNNIYKFKKEVIEFPLLQSYSTDIIALSIPELKIIYGLELKGIEERVRDQFIFLCMTGMRYSDLYTLTKSNIKDGIIIKKAVKTGIEFKVSLNSVALSILEKYDYKFTRYENQVFNRVIKDVLGKDIEELKFMKEKVDVKTESNGRTIITTNIEKYKLIASHTGRRTFITNCILQNVPIKSIMEMTSHTKIDTLLQYVEKFKKTDSEFVDRISF